MEQIGKESTPSNDQGEEEEEELVARPKILAVADSTEAGYSADSHEQLVGETSTSRREYKREVFQPEKKRSKLLSKVFCENENEKKNTKFSNTVDSFTRKRFQSVDKFEEMSLTTKKRVQVDEHLRNFGILCNDPKETASTSKISSQKNEVTLDAPLFQVNQAIDEDVFVSWEERTMEQQMRMVKSNLQRHSNASKVKFNPKVEIMLKNYKLYVTGTHFSSVEHADASATAPVEDEITFTQLFWCLPPEQKNKWVNCTMPGLKYKFNLTAVYDVTIDDSPKMIEVSSVSKFFITIGPPMQPDIRISDLDPLQVTLTWSLVETNPLVEIKGYQISIDDDTRVMEFGPDVRFPVVSDLLPESMHSVKMKILSCHSSGDSEFSNAVSVRVPPRPQAPKVNLLPVEDVGKITISWRIVAAEKTIERVKWCSIYIAEDNNEPGLHEKVSVESELMSFTFHDLNLSHSYRCFVKAHAGTNEISRSGYFGVCEVFSENSNVVYFTPSAPPVPGSLSVDCFLADSFIIQWTDSKEFGDAKIKGFQVIKDSEPYGPILSPKEREMTIERVKPGSLHRLQLIALSEHPVCKKALIIGGYASAQHFMQAVASSKAGNSQQARLRKIAQEDNDGSSFENQVIPGYEGCLPGPSMMVSFRGLVPRPVNISVQDIKGSSVVIKWDLGNQIEFQQRNPHYRIPTHFVVYWQLCESSSVYEQETEAFQIKLNYLQPKTKYKVIVESRGLQTVDEQKITVKSESELVYFSTGSPPSKPVGFSVVEVSHNHIKVSWKKPHVSGFELQGYRLEVSETLDGEKEFPGSRTYCYNIHPTTNLFTISQLEHTTRWKITLMVISNRFFEASRNPLIKENQPIPLGLKFRDIYNHWLPFDNLDVCTKSLSDSKVLVPSQVKPNSSLLKWASPLDDDDYNDIGVSGTAKVIRRQVIWYSEFSEHGGGPSSRYFDSVTLSGDTRAHLLTNLEPSIIYQINLEAVMAEKQEVDEMRYSEEYSEVYESLTIRTPAPILSPSLMVVGLTPETISLAWARPSTHRNPENVFSTRIVHRDLKEYRVVINGKNYKQVKREQQKAILTKCKPGKTYHFVLVTVTSTHHSFKSTDLVEQFSSIEDMSYSAPLSITLPNPEENGTIKTVRCEYINNTTDGPNELGYVKVAWTVHKEFSTMSNFDSGIDSFEVVWECSSQPDDLYSVSACASESWFLLPVQETGCTMKIHVIAFYRRQSRPPEKSETLVIETPSAPSKPSLLVHHVSQNFFIIEWTFEVSRGVNQVAGYRMYINGKKAGNILPPQFFKAKIASNVNKDYEVQLQVLSSDCRIGDSDLSEVLTVHTDWATIDFYKQIYLDTHGLADDYDLAHWSGRSAFNDATEQQFGEIKLALVDISEDEIVFRLKDLDRDLIKSVRVEWRSVNSNDTREAVFPPDQNLVPLSTFGHGVNHFIKFFGLEENGIVAAKSPQISALSAKKLEPPKIHAKKIDFTEIAITWLDKPSSKDMILGHRVFVNHKKVAELDNTVKSYTFTKGHMCREYKFEVQALANRESLDSTLSQPLVILWPGIITPEIDQVMTTSGNAIKIAWNSPFASKNVQILGYWVHCVLLEEDAKDDGLPSVEKQIVVGPLPSDITSYQFENLAYLCQYTIHLQLKIAGVDEFLTSNKLILRPMRFPHAPTIKAEVTGLLERRQLESDLIYELRSWNQMLSEILVDSSSEYTNTNIEQNYRQMGEILTKIAQFTGKIEGKLSWERLPSSKESELSGYKVLVNNVQIGSVLPKTQHTFNFKFSMGKPEYVLCVGSVVQQAAFPLQKSNSIIIESAYFLPFTVFCYFRVHNPTARWPSIGCCSVTDMLKEEFTDIHSKVRRIKSSLPERTNRPNPNVQVYSLFDEAHVGLPGKLPLLRAENSKGQRSELAVVLFYSYWCLSSQRIFRFLMSWASISSVKLQVITCCIDSRERADTHHGSLVSFIRGVKFFFGDNIKHTCGCFTKTSATKEDPDVDSERTGEHASEPQLTPKAKLSARSSTEAQDAYHLIGVPTITVISGSDNSIRWQGRPIVANVEQFSSFIGDVISSR